MAKGWNAKRQAFVQHYDSESLDASNLLMPLVFFLSPNDPRMLNTLEAINRSPKNGGLVSDGLVYRYDSETGEDGLHGGEGTFNMCTFWLVEALTRAGRVDRTKLMEADCCLSACWDMPTTWDFTRRKSGQRRSARELSAGLHPSGSLISAAFNLDRALDTKSKTR